MGGNALRQREQQCLHSREAEPADSGRSTGCPARGARAGGGNVRRLQLRMRLSYVCTFSAAERSTACWIMLGCVSRGLWKPMQKWTWHRVLLLTL